MFIHLLDLAILIPSLIEQMIAKYHSRPNIHKVGQPKLPEPLKLMKRHFLDFIPSIEKQAKPCKN